MCAQMLMHLIAHGGGRGGRTPKESALNVDSGKKIPCRTGESNLCQRRDGPMLYKLSHIPSFLMSVFPGHSASFSPRPLPAERDECRTELIRMFLVIRVLP